MNGCSVEPLGEDALLLRFGDAIDADANRRVHAAAARIAARRPAWLRDLVPAYASLALFVEVDAGDTDVLAEAERWLRASDCCDPPTASEDAVDSEVFEIPVRYGGEFGPDLEAVAGHARLPVRDAIERHAAGDYRVAMLGFAPGFPYLLGLDPALATPRLATPRTRVPAGSVGIGGAQAGLYPREGPGGWRLIGRTPLRLFDAARPTPSLLRPGQRVRFVAIDDDAFRRLAAQRTPRETR